MAKKIYVGVSGVARAVKQPYIGVSNVARKVKSGYIGVDGIARQFFPSGTPLNELSVGTSVYMNVNGSPKEFIIVHNGNPDTSIYDASCTGTWLLMKDLYSQMTWCTSDNYSTNDNDYKVSKVNTYLNNIFYNWFDDAAKNAIKQVVIPYVDGNGKDGTLSTGSSGFTTKVFLLSSRELGHTSRLGTDQHVDGAKLDYFPATTSTNSTKRKAYYNGTASWWWTRSPVASNTQGVWYVTEQGGVGTLSAGYGDVGVRPAVIIQSTALVDSSYHLIA